jgi:hypothetical protein
LATPTTRKKEKNMTSSLSPKLDMSLSLGCKHHQAIFSAKSNSIALATIKRKKNLNLKGEFGMARELEFLMHHQTTLDNENNLATFATK